MLIFRGRVEAVLDSRNQQPAQDRYAPLRATDLFRNVDVISGLEVKITQLLNELIETRKLAAKAIEESTEARKEAQAAKSAGCRCVLL